MPKKKPKVGYFELPVEFDTVEELNEWANSPDGAASLEDYFEAQVLLGSNIFTIDF